MRGMRGMQGVRIMWSVRGVLSGAQHAECT